LRLTDGGMIVRTHHVALGPDALDVARHPTDSETVLVLRATADGLCARNVASGEEHVVSVDIVDVVERFARAEYPVYLVADPARRRCWLWMAADDLVVDVALVSFPDGPLDARVVLHRRMIWATDRLSARPFVLEDGVLGFYVAGGVSCVADDGATWVRSAYESSARAAVTTPSGALLSVHGWSELDMEAGILVLEDGGVVKSLLTSPAFLDAYDVAVLGDGTIVVLAPTTDGGVLCIAMYP